MALDEFGDDIEAFVWSEATGVQVLPSDLDFLDDAPAGIAEDGETIITTNGAIWTASEGWHDIPSPCGDQATPIFQDAMTRFGQAFVGYCPWPFGQAGQMYRWDRPDAESAYQSLSLGIGYIGGISDDGRRLAYSTENGTVDVNARARLWDEDAGSAHDLELLPGFDTGSNAMTISGNGLVVGGQCWNADQAQIRAVLWIDESVLDLNDFVTGDGDLLQSVAALSNDGLRMIVSEQPYGGMSGNGAWYVDMFPIDDGDDDGDGLLNGWETEGVGIPYFGLDGQVHAYQLNLPGDNENDALPDHKNLFVEVDVMSNVPFGQAEADNVINSFFVAPVDNPDEIPGIMLHMDIQQDVFPLELVTDSTDGWPANAQELRAENFGTEAERLDSNSSTLLAAKAQAYRYCVVYNDVQITTEDNASIGGAAELPGDDMVLYLAWFDDEMGRSATFMHELGHNLGLGHGGGDSINGKPNYPSIMNYTMADPAPWSDGFWTLDYSREELAPIDEASLDELVSVGAGGSGYYANYVMPYFSIVTNGAPCFPPEDWDLPKIAYASLDPAATTDFNLDCDDTDTGIEVDLNFLEEGELPGSEGDPTPGDVLTGFNDWANIGLAVTDGGGAFRGPRPAGELTDEQRQFIHDNFPPPDSGECLADLTGDGSVDVFDLLQLLGAWGPCLDCPEDLDGSGTVDVFDLLQLLGAWGDCQ